jgi:Ca2+-binding RTX toxin-like protein
MAILDVPGSFSSIQNAVNAANAGDRIVVAQGYAGNENVLVTVNDLTFDVPGSVTGIVLTAGAGIGTISLAGGSPIQVVGTSGDDTVTGNSGANSFFTTIGTDALSGRQGSDVFTINGGAGTADGGQDSDTVRSTDLGTYTFYSTETLDSFGGSNIYGSLTQLRAFSTITDSQGAADSTLTFYLTGAGGRVNFADKVAGAHSIQVFSNAVTSAMDVVGTSNNDLLAGSAFDDRLNGGNGNDLIIGSGGTDVLIGGAGDDTFRIEYGGAGTLSGGTGTDTVISNDLGTFALSSVEILDINNFEEIRASVSQLSAFQTITDTVAAADSRIAILLNGVGGNINLGLRVAGSHSVYVADAGLSGAVSVVGTDNDDFMLIRSSFLTNLRGQGGDDTFEMDYAASYGVGSVNGGDGTDTVRSNDLGSFSFSRVEGLDTHGYGSVSATVAQLTQFSAIGDSEAAATSRISLLVHGAGGNINLQNRMDGSHSVHVVDSGLTGATSVAGTAFDDILEASANLDVLRGLAGDDTFVADYAAGGSIDGGAGTDTVQSNDLGSLSLSRVEILDAHGYGYINATAVQLAAFDTITDSGAAADSQLIITLNGAGGAVDLSSLAGAHSAALFAGALSSGLTAIGSANGDTIVGSNLADDLSGAGGDDRLAGSGGDDRLTGGSGADTFVFERFTEGLDTVTDFAVGTDLIEINASNFGGGLVANGAVQVFIAASAAGFSSAGTDGRFIFDNQGTDAGTLYWDVNGESGADAIAIGKFTGVAALSATDFHLA